MTKKTKYKVILTNRFKKDYKKIKTKNNFNEKELKDVINMLANDEILPEKYRNHILEPKSERNMGMPYKARLAFTIFQKQ